MWGVSAPAKPLGGKAYGHIPHLPGSRLGPGDHHCHQGQARICTEKVRDRHDVVIVQEKVDGSCCAVVRLGDDIVALGRSGYLAQTSKYEQHQWFAAWVREREARFRDLLDPGERVVGEWLAQAHGTRYRLTHEPFVVFDVFLPTGERLPFQPFVTRIAMRGFMMPNLVHVGGPLSIVDAMRKCAISGHGALDPVEGAVWRVERKGVVDFLAKYVRPDKVDGRYLPEQVGGEPMWNWRP